MFNKKIRAVVIIFSFTFLAGCIGSSSAQSKYHPDIAKLGDESDIETIAFSGQAKLPAEKEAMVYKSVMDVEKSIEIASECIGVDLSELDYTEIHGELELRDYKLETGLCTVELDTGYWSYSMSEKLLDREGVLPEQFLADEKIKILADDFIKSKNLFFTADDYDISIGDRSKGGWNSERRITSKYAYIDPSINSIPVYGVYRFIIQFDSEGNVIGLDSFCNPIEEVEKVSLKSKNAVDKALLNKDYSLGSTEVAGDATITDAKLIYYMDAAPNENNEFYVYPVYALTGSGKTEDGESEEFSLIVDAVQ